MVDLPVFHSTSKISRREVDIRAIERLPVAESDKTGFEQGSCPLFPVPLASDRAVVTVEILLRIEHHLFKIAEAGGSARLLARPVQRRQQHTGENRDDGDDYQQFDQSKRLAHNTWYVKQSSTAAGRKSAVCAADGKGATHGR